MNSMMDYANKLCEGKGDVLYVTQFGSHLYGTNSPSSDTDYKGLFLPSKQEMLVGNHCRSLQYSSGDDNEKNSSNDIDIQLWSLQYWLEMLRAGETNAQDLLFSMKADHVEKYDALRLLERYDASGLLDVRHSRRYVAYAHAQARKYGLKGTRMGVLKSILQYVHEDPAIQDGLHRGERAGVFFPELVKRFGDASLCFVKEANGAPMLFILGKGYGAFITVKEMSDRLQREFDKYGARVAMAEQNEGIDWKAISHAVRCLDQMLELIHTGFVQYPLERASFLREIKQGHISWGEVEPLISRMLDEVDHEIGTAPENPDAINTHRRIILETYECLHELTQQQDRSHCLSLSNVP